MPRMVGEYFSKLCSPNWQLANVYCKHLGCYMERTSRFSRACKLFFMLMEMPKIIFCFSLITCIRTPMLTTKFQLTSRTLNGFQRNPNPGFIRFLQFLSLLFFTSRSSTIYGDTGSNNWDLCQSETNVRLSKGFKATFGRKKKFSTGMSYFF